MAKNPVQVSIAIPRICIGRFFGEVKKKAIILRLTDASNEMHERVISEFKLKVKRKWTL